MGKERKTQTEKQVISLQSISPSSVSLLQQSGMLLKWELSGSGISYIRYSLAKEYRRDTQKLYFWGQEYRIVHFILKLTGYFTKISLESKNIHRTPQASKAAVYCSLLLSRDFTLLNRII